MSPRSEVDMLAPAAESDVEICVVIVNYRTPGMVIDCLETLVPQLEGLAARVVIVDNASPDDSLSRIGRWLEANCPGDLVELLASRENGGFAAGNNLGITSCVARYYLLLNSDTLVCDGAIAAMLATMRSDSTLGLLSPRLQWPDGTPQESCFRFHRPMSELVATAGTGVVTKVLERYRVPIDVSESQSRPEWTSFACVLIRREVFEAVGLLDEGFFMYYEDVEFAHRAARAGWPVLHDPTAKVVHLRGGSSPVKARARRRARLPPYFHESRARYFYLLYGSMGLLAANVLWTAGWSISAIRSFFRRSYVPPTCESQWRDIWVHFTDPLAPYTHPQNESKP
jgi:GT2 family glycosyltransferase